MSTPHPDVETPAQYHSRLSDHCPMPLNRWRQLKGLAYSALIVTLALLWLRYQGSPIVYASTIVAILLIQFVEIKEVQIMDAISITLFPTDRDSDDSE